MKILRRSLTKNNKKSKFKQLHHLKKEDILMEKCISDLLADIQRVKSGGNLKVFTGTADPFAYNDEEVVNALIDLKKRGGRIQVCVSCLFLVDDKGKNKLIELTDEVYYRKKREAAIHYRIVDNPDERKSCSTESPHRVLASSKEREPGSFEDEEDCAFWAEKLDIDFQMWKGEKNLLQYKKQN